jgi:hypothetical protein
MKNPRVVRRRDYSHFDEECRKTERLVHGRVFFLPRSVVITTGIILVAVAITGAVFLVNTALLRNDRFEDARITEHSQMAEKVFGKK